jgi:hypothetical protein
MANLVVNGEILNVPAGIYTVRVQLYADNGTFVDEAVSAPVLVAEAIIGPADVQVPQVGVRGIGGTKGSPGGGGAPRPPKV